MVKITTPVTPTPGVGTTLSDFVPLVSLHSRLDLSYNSLPEDGDRGELPEDQLYSLPHLRYLDLTNCSIRQLPMTAFVNNMELRELRYVGHHHS